jgi:hypothetical protein
MRALNEGRDGQAPQPLDKAGGRAFTKITRRQATGDAVSGNAVYARNLGNFSNRNTLTESAVDFQR